MEGQLERTQRLHNQWFQAKPAPWKEDKYRKERDFLFQLVRSEENISAVVSGLFRLNGHGLDRKEGILAATAERILFLRKGLSDSRGIVELELDAVRSTSFFVGMLHGEVTINTREPYSGFKVSHTDPADSAQIFVDGLDKQLETHRGLNGSSSVLPVLSTKDRILKQWLEVMPKGWGTFGDDGMHKGERGMLIDIVDDDEDVLALVGGTFRADTNRIHKHNGIAVATAKRILFLDKGVLGSKEVMEIGYRNIEAITYSTGMLMGGIQITGLGTAGFRIEDIRPKESNKPFADCVRQLIDQVREQDLSPRQAETVGQLSSADELQKLVSLLQDGHITPEEFVTMKSRIIQEN